MPGKRKGGGAGKKGSALVRELNGKDRVMHFTNLYSGWRKKLHNTKYPKVTCPGFPGYCSESYPGDVCLVVCAFGRNNVPQCQVCYIFFQLSFLFL